MSFRRFWWFQIRNHIRRKYQWNFQYGSQPLERKTCNKSLKQKYQNTEKNFMKVPERQQQCAICVANFIFATYLFIHKFERSRLNVKLSNHLMSYKYIWSSQTYNPREIFAKTFKNIKLSNNDFNDNGNMVLEIVVLYVVE